MTDDQRSQAWRIAYNLYDFLNGDVDLPLNVRVALMACRNMLDAMARGAAVTS